MPLKVIRNVSVEMGGCVNDWWRAASTACCMLPLLDGPSKLMSDGQFSQIFAEKSV